jgi:8-oxo-dGTP diphosphatase
MRARLRRFLHLALLLGIRYTPLPWAVKWRLIWLGGPKVLFAACAVIHDASGRVLVLRSRYSGQWQFPGGCAERGESALHTLERECREELGLDVHNPMLVGVYVDMDGLTQCALFTCGLGAGPITLSDEHTAYRYAPITELPPALRRMVACAPERRPTSAG